MKKEKKRTEVPQFASHWPKPQNTDCMYGVSSAVSVFCLSLRLPLESPSHKNVNLSWPLTQGSWSQVFLGDKNVMLYCVFALYEQCNIQNAELMKNVLEKIESYTFISFGRGPSINYTA